MTLVKNTFESNDFGDNGMDDYNGYDEHVYRNFRRKEENYSVLHDYMKKQKDINGQMRAILIDWLVQVHYKLELSLETLWLTVNLLDRYLSNNVIGRGNLQLVGVACMFIAAKYEERDGYPGCKIFERMCVSTYTCKQILNMEVSILVDLNFNLTVPTSLHFLHLLSRNNYAAEPARYEANILSHYLLELCLVDMDLNMYYPSLIASASIYLSNQMTNIFPTWSTELERRSGYDLECVHQVAVKMLALVKNAQTSTLQAIINKYKTTDFGQVALLSIPETIV